MTSGSFDNALLMKARIHAKDGHWDEARTALKRYSSKAKNNADPSAAELLADMTEAEKAAKKASQAKKAQLWTACMESASQALKTASHSLEMRQVRAECALASGDIEGAIGDLT